MKNATDINMLVQNLSAYAIYDLSKHSKLFMDWYLSKSDNDTEQNIEEIYTASSPKIQVHIAPIPTSFLLEN